MNRASRRHLRPRDGSQQPTTAVELLFDLVYVFAVTQLSQLLIGDLSLAGAARTAFLLLVVWWAWIYTTWMVNWFDPTSGAVRLVMVAATLASLLMSAAIPEAFGSLPLLFAGAYVALQLGRNLAGMVLLSREHALRGTFERIVAWSPGLQCALDRGGPGVKPASGGAVGTGAGRRSGGAARRLLDAGPGSLRDQRLRDRGAHFAERFPSFIIIALGESIVVTGATASAKGSRPRWYWR